MGLGDLFKGSEYKAQLEKLTSDYQNLFADNQRLFDENARMSRLMTPELQDIQNRQVFSNELDDTISSKKKELDNLILTKEEELDNLISDKEKELENITEQIRSSKESLSRVLEEIKEKKQDVVELEDKILLQDFGLYTPMYDLTNSEQYKDRLTIIRQNQKEMIKNDTACSFPQNFTLDGSIPKGKKLVKDNVKQILRSFNNECETAIDKVKFNNVEAVRKKIEKSYESLNKMNSGMQIRIMPNYLNLKLEELNLSYEYAMKKQEEKEEQREIREQLKEEAKLQKEIEEARKNINKEQAHYQNALRKLQIQIDSSTEEERNELLTKKEEVMKHLEELDVSLKDIDYREANKRAGYVYIISNIGSFGEDVFKIGMTRRLEPLDRVKELGDASVPFNFDLHALIFSDDAPKLENSLHHAFEDRKINMINHRREFFNVSLKEIEEVVKREFDKTVEFKEMPDAEQYRETLMIKKEIDLKENS